MRSKRAGRRGANADTDVLLQLQFGEELARRYEQEHIAIELRAADIKAREARTNEMMARIRQLEAAVEQSFAEQRHPALSASADAVADGAAQPLGVAASRLPKRKRLGKQLVKQGLVTKRVVRGALKVQKETGAPLGEILVARGALTVAQLLEALAQQHGVAPVGPDDRGIGLLPPPVALEHRAVALELGGRPVAPGALTAVAVVDVNSAEAISSALGHAIEPRLADAETVVRLLADAYARPAAPAAAVAAEPAPVVDLQPATEATVPVTAPGLGHRPVIARTALVDVRLPSTADPERDAGDEPALDSEPEAAAEPVGEAEPIAPPPAAAPVETVRPPKPQPAAGGWVAPSAPEARDSAPAIALKPGTAPARPPVAAPAPVSLSAAETPRRGWLGRRQRRSAGGAIAQPGAGTERASAPIGSEPGGD